MFRSFIAGAAALGLAVAAQPNEAKADNAILGGVLIGAVLGGTVAAIAESNHRREYHAPPPPRVYHTRRPARGYYGHVHRRPVVVERRVYRRPAPRVVYRDHHRPGYYGHGHGPHYR
ncbi:hypothetical protein G5B40_10710 [Pikeienuella piscinae]|uniref:Glycine zipper domain-containing protein n=1 Tax=Pikeienuella piscinae TaxID=2748098 RepID=A0A7L5C038_9RHOB|nr:hypothetical protein [Pikeienuella piscinae]QIE55876.1 hypothetical protein G5B40_10710 [Pikeienuella piscinae]